MDLLNNITPRVTLVGAGPGDPELLTLKAVKALRNADAVLFDALVNEDILKHAPNAVKLFVGKRKGCHSYMQEQINDLLVAYALRHGHVVRLKGGDPFVFGRGLEEMNYLYEAGIPCEVIPGISSATAVPAMAGISLTHRKVAHSFWVLTGTTSEHLLSEDVKLAAQSKATVVILMGMNKLSEIVSVYTNYGKAETPIAIIQHGTQQNERRVIGNISNIQSLVETQKLSSPAIIVIGEVVDLGKLNSIALEDDFIYQNLGMYPIPV